MSVAEMTYEELFAAAVVEARRKDVNVWDESPPLNCTVVADGLRMHYLDWRGEAGMPLVLVHGALLNAHAWDFFCLEMRQHFRILSVDLPGHGDSEWAADADYSRPRLAGHLRDLIDRLGLEAFAEHAAQFNPRRRADRLALSLRWNTRQLPDGNWTWKYDRALRHRSPDRPVRWRTDDFEKVWSVLGGLECPVLYVRAGEHSHLTDEAAARLGAMSHVRLVSVPEAGHNVMGDNPHAFARLVGEFLLAAGTREG